MATLFHRNDLLVTAKIMQKAFSRNVKYYRLSDLNVNFENNEVENET